MKKKVVISIVSLATQEINGIASISRNSVSMLKSAFSNSSIMAEYLKSIFLTCAGYENTLWDELYS